jgi:hypothetical protein
MAVPCRSCGAAVVWLVHERTGRPAPVDAEPDPAGNVEPLDGGRYRIAPPDLFGGPRHMPHYATCPDAAAWRARLEERPRPAPREAP